jgi:uncharacterized protein (TIGR02996 family)
MTHTTDSRALIAAIRAHYDEDTPRLVYADYLQENGLDPAREELIRVQVEHSRRPSQHTQDAAGVCTASCERCKSSCLEMRAHELVAENESRWRAGPTCAACEGAGVAVMCTGCWRGDAGGLMALNPREQLSHRDRPPWLYPVAFWGGFIRRVTAPRMTDCLYDEFEEHAPSRWLRAVLTVTDDHPERALIREVVPADREPLAVTAAHTKWLGLYQWFSWINGDKQRSNDGSGRAFAELPRAVFEAVAGLSDQTFYDEYARFKTRAAAVSALGTAIVRWARGEPGTRP